MNATTNSYKKLANIAFKRETEEMYYDNLADDADVNAEGYCQQALTLLERFRNCYNSDHVDSVVQYLLDKMQPKHSRKSVFYPEHSPTAS